MKNIQRKLSATILVGLSSLLLVACSQASNRNSKATTTQSSVKTHGKKSFYTKNSSKKATSTKSNTDTSNNNFNFPSRMLGTWYSYSEADHKMNTATFTNNLWESSTNKTLEAHDGSKRTSADIAILNGNGSPEKAKENWVAAGYMEHVDGLFSGDENASKILNLRGWYQGSGDGTYFYNTTQTVDGKKIEVLTEADSAMIATSAHYYKSPVLAKTHASDTYDADNH